MDSSKYTHVLKVTPETHKKIKMLAAAYGFKMGELSATIIDYGIIAFERDMDNTSIKKQNRELEGK